jgi:hypothetical protein
MDNIDVEKYIKRNIQDYISYTNKLNNLHTKPHLKSLKGMFVGIRNMAGNMLIDFAKSHKDLYFKVIEDMNISDALENAKQLNEKNKNKWR